MKKRKKLKIILYKSYFIQLLFLIFSFILSSIKFSSTNFLPIISPGAWACTTAWSAWARPSCPFPAAAPGGRSCSCAISARPSFAAPPSYALYLYEAILEAGISIEDLKLHTGIFGAEPSWSEKMRTEIEAQLRIKALDIYGLSEIMGPGAGMECCDAQDGLHIWEDHFLIEIIDPETGEQMPLGETGELVITTITKEAQPLVRHRTRDITRCCR